MIRTFVAVEISPEVRERAKSLIAECQSQGIDAKWVLADAMHVTLQFLGNVRENQIPLICREVSRAVRGFPAFDCLCQGVGAFPSAARPRVLWIGMTQGRDELIALQGRVEKALDGMGFRGEARRFEPHLTLGRLRGDSAGSRDLAEFVATHADYDGGGFEVSEVLVVSSELLKTGPRYEVLGRAELGG